MRKLLLLELSPAVRAVVATGLIIVVIAAALVTEYFVASWRAGQAVRQSQQALCGIVNLVTATPVPKPANPASNPSRETSYRFYQAFVIVGRQYHC